jgi:hypothetical protein
MKPVVVVGLGQMGGVFAHAFLRAGHPVYPVTREASVGEVGERVLAPALTMICVAEADLEAALASLPMRWRVSVGLLQNELLPRDWEAHAIADPTVAVVWFEKKKTTPVTPIRPTLVAGPQAAMVVEALRSIDIPAEAIESGEPLVHALAAKNLYILTANIGGLATGADTVGELWREHRVTAEAHFDEIFSVQRHLAAAELPRDELLHDVLDAVAADPDHKAKGRTARARLLRTLEHARTAALSTPRLAELAGDEEE